MAKSPAQDFAAVIVAAGRSSRLGGPLPKQFVELGGRLIVEHAIDRLAASPSVAEVVVVVAPNEVDGQIAARLRENRTVSAVVAGGATRADSVALGIAVVSEACRYVLVHDAARPLASPGLVERVVRATRVHGAAIPVVAVPDTVKKIDGKHVAGTIDRTKLRLAQTPQGAVRELLAEVLGGRDAASWTDEAAALEAVGQAVAVVEGETENFKITTAADLVRARREVEGCEVELRVGTGFDVHRTDPSRPLVLGGVRFEGEAGLAGHSDADVVLHAAMDAVLGAAGVGDIGTHFPPDEDRWEGADSVELSRIVARIIKDAGFRIVNLDLTVLAERPKVGPRASEMRASIAAAFGLGVERVGLKATTLEGLGALGRQEGLGCQAVALLARDPG